VLGTWLKCSDRPTLLTAGWGNEPTKRQCGSVVERFDLDSASHFTYSNVFQNGDSGDIGTWWTLTCWAVWYQHDPGRYVQPRNNRQFDEPDLKLKARGLLCQGPYCITKINSLAWGRQQIAADWLFSDLTNRRDRSYDGRDSQFPSHAGSQCCMLLSNLQRGTRADDFESFLEGKEP